MGGGSGANAGRPGGVSEKDDLKDFHLALAVEATAEQRTAFAQAMRDTQAASELLKTFRKSLSRETAAGESVSGGPAEKAAADSTPAPLGERAGAVEQAIEKARDENKKFTGSFSAAQKSGLKDIRKKLEKADSELEKETKALEQSVEAPKAESAALGNSAASLGKALGGFEDEQLALGRQMGILVGGEGQELSFQLPKTTKTIEIDGQAVSIAAVVAASRTSAENGHNIFRVKLTADLSDAQHSITEILRPALRRSPRCGERLEIEQARLEPAGLGAGVVVARMHYERWVCAPGRGAESAVEVAGGEGTIEIKLTPAVDAKTGLGLDSEIRKVEADRMLRDLLGSGELGVTVREGTAAALLRVMQKGADLKGALPAVAQEAVTLEKAQFQDAGAGQLNLVLEGQMQFSDEQAAQFAAQLKERLAAQGASTP
jgi:hypothetical protein